MKNLVAENIQEFRDLLNSLEETKEEKVDEGVLDFFKSMRALVNQALKDPNNEENVNKALSVAFAKQFGKNPKIKEVILKWDLSKKQELLKLAAEKLQDPKIGYLTLVKNTEGKVVVAGSQLSGGAAKTVTGA
jgi:hypothetical protein